MVQQTPMKVSESLFWMEHLIPVYQIHLSHTP